MSAPQQHQALSAVSLFWSQVVGDAWADYDGAPSFKYAERWLSLEEFWVEGLARKAEFATPSGRANLGGRNSNLNLSSNRNHTHRSITCKSGCNVGNFKQQGVRNCLPAMPWHLAHLYKSIMNSALKMSQAHTKQHN